MEFNVLSGPDAGRVFSGNVTVATIGRGSGNLVALGDPKISRQHARLEVTATGVSIVDLGSTNGTFVNGQRLAGRTARPLQPGDEVRVGDTRLRFMGLAAAAPAWDDLPEDQVYAMTPGGRPRWLIPVLAVVALLLLAAAAVWLLGGGADGDVSDAEATRTAGAPVIVATPDTPTPVIYRATAAPAAPGDAAPSPTEGVVTPAAPAAPAGDTGQAPGGALPGQGQQPGGALPGLPGQGEQPGGGLPGLPGQGEQPGGGLPGLPGQGEQPGGGLPGLPGQGGQPGGGLPGLPGQGGQPGGSLPGLPGLPGQGDVPGGGLPLAPGQPGGVGGESAGGTALAQPNAATLEQIPLSVAMLFPGVSAEQLPQAIGQAAAGGQLTSAQTQVVASQLFPGVPVQQLPQVIQSSFPGVPANQMQAVFDLLFPGRGVTVPGASPLSGVIFYSAMAPDGRLQIYQINVDGSNRQLLLEDASEPAISPDRQWLAYYSWRPDALGLRLRNLATGEDRQLTADNNDSYPSWSPDGRRLAFWNYANDTVHTINFDGSDRRQIAKGQFAAWSPAGDRIAFKGCVGGGSCGIVIANPDGGNPTLLTTHANDGQPAWSPDGRALTFVSDRSGNWDIYAINADGSWLRRITDNPTTDGLPEWSLDGTRIAFRSDRDGRWAIWVASGVGGAAVKLVDADTGPRWQWEKISWK